MCNMLAADQGTGPGVYGCFPKEVVLFCFSSRGGGWWSLDTSFLLGGGGSLKEDFSFGVYIGVPDFFSRLTVICHLRSISGVGLGYTSAGVRLSWLAYWSQGFMQ